jgi:acyl-homoserine-lactone acylase
VRFEGKRRGLLAAFVASLLALAVPGSAAAIEAKVQTTRYGVPHITAKSIKSLAYGYGYVFARDNICTMANEYVTVSAERSRYFGPDANWRFSGNGATYKNLDADFYYASINESGIVEDLISRDPPEGPLPAVEKGVEGYVAGYNQYLEDTGVNRLPDSTCRGADWVRPITELDVYRRFHQLGSLASAGAAIDGIATAAPVLDLPKVKAAEERQDQALEDLKNAEAEEFFPIESGSNAYGLGAEATRNGRGMVLGNPHFPWDGAERLYQAHLRVPGKLDVSGGSLYGVPLVLIGHTRGLAWSHTVASAWRFTPFELTLNPLNPRQYLVDGEFRNMEATELTVKALVNGELEDRTRTLYSTEYGPMLTSILGLPLFPWTPLKGFALGDANYENFRYLNHFLKTNLAQDVHEYDEIQQRFQGIPWVNSIAADRHGEAYYSMDGTIPNVNDADASAPWPLGCAGVLGVATYPLTGIAVMDGSHSECDWDTDPDAVTEGVIGPDRIPRLFRDDYVHNGNDSHWVSNPEQPLTGYDRIIGDENTERSLRTRIGLLQVQQRLDGSDGMPGDRFSFKQLRDVSLSNRQYAGELWRDELVALCQSSPTQLGSNGPVNVAAACPVLASWDVHDNLDSSGAILFRRFAENLLSNFQFLPTGVSSGMYTGSNVIWDQQFNPGDPVNTPRGLAEGNPLVGKALADAVTDLQGAGIPLDAGLRGHQYETRAGKEIPIHGGPGELGLFNAINVSWDPSAGYPNVPHGSSFIAAMSFRKKRCPVRAHTFVTYGQTENQESRHASDYTRAFSQKRWNRVPFCAKDVRTSPGVKTERIGSGG